ncbi:MAG TPA: hypothetical protein O0X50_01660, partial [Methanocorpusculum sp.]|nr:hypothetical protein [Methanocorpusculum sp.]
SYILYIMTAGKKSSGKIQGGSDSDAYSAYAHSVNPLITCDVCGEKYPKSEMRQCAKCGMIVCPGCWPQHRCEMDRSPLVKAKRKVERNAAESHVFWKPVDTIMRFVMAHKLQVLIGVGIGILVAILVIVIAVCAGGHDPVEGTWETTENGLTLVLKLENGGSGSLFTTELGIDIAYDVLWKNVDNAENPYSIALGNQWYPQGNSRLSADNTLLTVGTNNTVTYLKDIVLTFTKIS